mmetsp:Transcript_69857/g.155688  ORF Transcript_69857/g.155688 Transcript_69857/m.155688 type:complete len:233 (-) Transcript_69857:77-775(-)
MNASPTRMNVSPTCSLLRTHRIFSSLCSELNLRQLAASVRCGSELVASSGHETRVARQDAANDRLVFRAIVRQPRALALKTHLAPNDSTAEVRVADQRLSLGPLEGDVAPGAHPNLVPGSRNVARIAGKDTVNLLLILPQLCGVGVLVPPLRALCAEDPESGFGRIAQLVHISLFTLYCHAEFRHTTISGTTILIACTWPITSIARQDAGDRVLVRQLLSRVRVQKLAYLDR